jgi:hypothetical protein
MRRQLTCQIAEATKPSTIIMNANGFNSFASWRCWRDALGFVARCYSFSREAQRTPGLLKSILRSLV